MFFPEFGASENVTFDTKISGTLNDLSLQNLRLSTNRSTYISGQFAFKNLIDSKSIPLEMTGQIGQMRSKYTDLKGILPRILGKNIPSNLAALGVFNLQGNILLSGPSIKADFDAKTEPSEGET